MGTMNISLPDSMKEFVDEQVAGRGFGTSSEYVRELIRRDQDRCRVREMLLSGAGASLGEPAAPAYFEDLRARARNRKAR
jgi:antitoxin ParD1/3/4